MNVAVNKARELKPDSAEWQARVDLAAAHRIANNAGLNEGIFNHLTLAVPEHNDRYLQIPFGMHWSEVTASCFIDLDGDGNLLAGEGIIERSCYCIHAPLHRLLPDAACVLHTHMPFASALSRLEDPRILPIGQTELAIMYQTGYDLEYGGPAFEPVEGERLAALIGDKKILIMANHGALTIGRTVAEAYDRLYYLERVAQVQLYAMWTGRPLKVLPQEMIDETIRQFKESMPKYGGRPSNAHHFDALKRVLDRNEADYRN